MEIRVEKLTSIIEARRACEFTMNSLAKKGSLMSREKLYNCEHSPIRTQVFEVSMIGIPTSVSVHFVRHNVGVQHFVSTNRPDRGAEKTADRNTPVDHLMLLNAQTLINMSRKRLCYKAAPETRNVMIDIVNALEICDEALTCFLVPECIYRGGFCHELSMCGKMPSIVHVKPENRQRILLEKSLPANTETSQNS